jgi:hypothetical protein
MPTCAQRLAAAESFFRAWSLLLHPLRTPADDAAMVQAAHLCAEQLALLGLPGERVRGEWLLARVMTALGRHGPALLHARRAECLAQAHALRGTERFRVRAALACAYDHTGDGDAAKHWLHLAAGTLVDMSEVEAANASRDLDRLAHFHG